MRVSVLGPVEVQDAAGRSLPVNGALVRRLLVRLAVDAPRGVSSRELVEAVWCDSEPPAQVANALQSLVSRLRRALGGPDAVQQTATGYRLNGVDTDLAEFEQKTAHGRRLLAHGDVAMAADTIRTALRLWSGEALVDAGDAEYAVALSARLAEARLDAIGDRIDAELASGRGADLVPELEELTRALPLRERLIGQHMQALARSGRPAEALLLYERTRECLADELGADPSRSLQDLHLSLLRGDLPVAVPAGVGSSAGVDLRPSLTSFVGREDELRRIHELLSSGRLVSVIGPGGAGKTRLAGEAARSWVPPTRWDGSWLVELAPITEEASLLQAVLTSLGVREARTVERPTELPASRDPLTRLIESLRGRHCLLLVDNCEHLIDGVARLLAQLLGSCPHLRVLTTSREPLGIDGESLCVLPPLSLPASGAEPKQALTYPAVQLLEQRAAAVRADFHVDDDNVADVVEIVRRLDGLPLAIELAAARLRVLPVGEVAARLTDRFLLLTGGSRAALPRHRTLRAVVQWSWDLLTPAERLLAERLAVFPAGATVTSAEEVGAGAPVARPAVRALLDSLVDKSLLNVVEETPLRYRMLETIREYGVERLAERGEVDAVRHAHARHFAAVVQAEAPRIRTADQVAAFRVVEREYDNVVAALRFLGDSGRAEEALTLAMDLSWYWILRNEHADAHTWLSFVAALPEGDGSDLHVLARAGMTLNKVATGESFDPAEIVDVDPDDLVDSARDLQKLPDLGERFEPVRALLEVGLALMSGDEVGLDVVLEKVLRAPDAWTRAAVRTFHAAVAENRGDVATMRRDVDSALADFRVIGDRWGLATTLASVGYLRTLDGELDAASAAYEEAARLMEELGARSDGGFLRLRLAGVRVRQGRYDGARALVEAEIASTQGRADAIATFGTALLASIAAVEGDDATMRRHRADVESQVGRLEGGHPFSGHGRAICLGTLGQLYADEGEPEIALGFLTRAYDAALATRDQPIVAAVGVAVASAAMGLGRADHAARILGACAVLRGGDDRTDPVLRRLVPALRANLGGHRFEEEYARGCAQPRAAATAEVDPRTLPGP